MQFLNPREYKYTANFIFFLLKITSQLHITYSFRSNNLYMHGLLKFQWYSIM